MGFRRILSGRAGYLGWDSIEARSCRERKLPERQRFFGLEGRDHAGESLAGNDSREASSIESSLSLRSTRSRFGDSRLDGCRPGFCFCEFMTKVLRRAGSLSMMPQEDRRAGPHELNVR